ncbi:MAG TPA: TraM recognition domain-containing protein [Mycobacteriales bacterium]|nr:TraM recognition domain-containing protein [Mycobacteriales bacterium]
MTGAGHERFPEAHPIEIVVAAGLGVAVLLAASGWLIAETSAALAGHLAHLDFTGGLRGLIAWRHFTGDPRQGFPPTSQRLMPGPVGMYLAVAVDIPAVALVGAAALRLATRIRVSSRRGYASSSEVRRALSARAARARGRDNQRRATKGGATVALGVDVRSRQHLFGATEDSYLYLGPPRSGKGVHLIIPQTIDAPGAALVTATRPDTLRHTLPLRAQHGPVAVFDPQHLAGEQVPRLRWAPHSGCANPLTAITRARALTAGAQLSPATVTDAAFWDGMTQAVLRCYLHAAALEHHTMRDVVGWTSRPSDPTPVRILRRHPDAAPGWADELAAQAAADPRQRDSVWAGVRRAVDALADPRVLESCSPEEGEGFDPASFLAGRGTLYLLGTTGAQLTVAPLVTALVEALIDAARTAGAGAVDGRLDPPLTVLLDEAANIAPIPSLPNLLADGGGSGITTVCVLQSLAQARARWGQAGADAMWDAATTKVILGGLAHAEDLHRISQLVGEIDEPVRTRTRGAGGASTSVGPRRLPVLPVDALRTLRPGHAIVLARNARPVEARLCPWWDGPHASAIRMAIGPKSDRVPGGCGRPS